MVTNHYRWDFIGLSTDEKPTPATSEKVTNGSTFYCSDNSKLYVWYKNQWYERKALGGGGGGGGTTYTAGEGIDITDDTISVDTTTIQPKLTAGSNVTISGSTISATDTTYSAFTGTDGVDAGTSGLVPAPATTDAGKFLKSDGTWDTAGGGSITPVQTTGTSTTDVMSQNAVSSMIFANPGTDTQVKIGTTAYSSGQSFVSIGNGSQCYGNQSTAVGHDAKAQSVASVAIGDSTVAGSNSTSYRAVAIGQNAHANKLGSVAVGANSEANSVGEFNIGTTNSAWGYNTSNYRLLSGLYDGQTAHDAVTVAQVNGVIDAINAALSTNISHIGA